MRRRTIVVLPAAIVIAMTLIAAPVHGQFNVIYKFGSGGNSDPCQPQNSGIIAQGQDGNLYTTVTGCGANDGGSAIRVTPAGTLTDISDFSAQGGAIYSPFGGLTLNPSTGNFYGTTQGGGTDGDGTLFTLTPAGGVSVLFNFTGGSDGYTVDAPPVVGLDGNLYGTSRRGGNFVACGGTGCGVVYKMTPSGTLIWSYEFDITHGLYPYAPLLQGTDGNFYGTTQEGGTGAGLGSGTVFKITPAGVLTVLHSFCSKTLCADGQYPLGPLNQGNDGKFYGTTVNGGANTVGEVFKITPSGALTVLHSMTSANDGQNPYGGLVLASDGNFYGTNQLGGTHSAGTIFKITSQGVLTVLYNFDGATGAQPMVTLVQHTNGTLYGDTFQGGTGAETNCGAGTCGVFYKYNATGLKSFIKLAPSSGNVGSQIGILGQGFTGSSVVKFNGIVASHTLTGSTFITATVPKGTLDGYVTVTTGNTTLKSVQKFAVHDSWGSGAAVPTASVASCAAVSSGQVYVVGGYNNSPLTNNQIYNPSTNKWTAGTALATGLSNQACAGVNGEIYEFGGTNNIGASQTNAVWAYNPSTKVWTSKTAMPTARQDIVAVVDKGLVYVIGGYNGNRLSTLEVYDPATDTWTSEASLLVAQSGNTAGLIGSNIVISGGAGQSVDTGDTESYSVSKNSWTTLKPDSTLRNNPCGGVIGTSLYVAGGENRATPPASNVLEAFAPSSKTWTTLSSIPQGTVDAGSAVVNGQLFCFGGWAAFQGTVLNNVQIYQP